MSHEQSDFLPAMSLFAILAALAAFVLAGGIVWVLVAAGIGSLAGLLVAAGDAEPAGRHPRTAEQTFAHSPLREEP